MRWTKQRIKQFSVSCLWYFWYWMKKTPEKKGSDSTILAPYTAAASYNLNESRVCWRAAYCEWTFIWRYRSQKVSPLNSSLAEELLDLIVEYSYSGYYKQQLNRAHVFIIFNAAAAVSAVRGQRGLPSAQLRRKLLRKPSDGRLIGFVASDLWGSQMWLGKCFRDKWD